MKKTLFLFISNFIVFMVVIIIGLLTHSDPRFFEGDSLSEFSNDYCQQPENNESIICKNKYKTNKFILLFIDGTAYDSLQFLTNPEKYNLTKIYRNHKNELKITRLNNEKKFNVKNKKKYQ